MNSPAPRNPRGLLIAYAEVFVKPAMGQDVWDWQMESFSSG